MALGIGFPGAGFLNWAVPDQLLPAFTLFAAGIGLFAVTLVVWFAIGNVVAPLAAWLSLAGLAAAPEFVGLDRTQADHSWPWLIGPSVLLAGLGAWLRSRRARGRRPLRTEPTFAASKPVGPDRGALSNEDIRRLRLLLDRALQPPSEFSGFEWRDQFQTAAVRYQVNFISYALAMVQRWWAPAASAYFAEAQENLLTKIGDRRLWGYWRFENAWGNLRLDADPVVHQNIMYSGFAALQMAVGGGCRLELHRGGKKWRGYDLREMVAVFGGIL